MNRNCVLNSITIKEAISALEIVEYKILVVLDNEDKVVGTVTDGDIRRGMLKEFGSSECVSSVMNQTPVLFHKDDKQVEIIRKMEQDLIFYVPLVDSDSKFIDLVSLQSIKSNLYSNCGVFILAGGLGSRLKDLTKDTPKPMLPINGKPMLERLLLSFKRQGFQRFFISVNYLKEKIMDYFGDGSAFGIEIIYIIEDKRLGTAGPLSLLERKSFQEDQLIVINADVCIHTDYRALIRYHNSYKNAMTVCAKEHEYQVPYGVVRYEGDRLLAIEEKPVETFFVNAGIYLLQKEAISLLEANAYCDMPNFINQVNAQGHKVGVFPFYEDWIDVGLPADYGKVCG